MTNTRRSRCVWGCGQSWKRQKRILEDDIASDAAKIDGERQSREEVLAADQHRRIAKLTVDGASERDKAIAQLQFEAAEFAAQLDAEKQRRAANGNREIEVVRFTHVADNLDLVDDQNLANLATVFSALPAARSELQRVLTKYNNPSSKIAKAGGTLGDVIASFVSMSGGPFTQSDIDAIRKSEEEHAAAFSSVREALDWAEKVQQAKRRCALLEDPVNRGVQLEELAPEYAVPD